MNGNNGNNDKENRAIVKCCVWAHKLSSLIFVIFYFIFMNAINEFLHI